MSDINKGFRLLLSQKLQSLLLVFGFAIFICLIHVTTQLAPSLFSPTPAWVESRGNFVTVGLKGHDGRMYRTSLRNLESASESVGIDSFGYIGSDVARFSLNDEEFEGRVLMFSNNLAEMLEVSELTSDGDDFRDVAYVSERFWKENFPELDINSQTLRLGEGDFPLRLVGVLPPTLNELGEWQPDILISASHLMEVNPVEFGDNPPPPEYLDLVLEEIRVQEPIWFGIARLASGFKIEDLNISIDPDSTPSNVRLLSSSGNLEPYVYEGIEIQPDQRDALMRQWWFVLFLAAGFGLVNILNLLTFSLNQFIKRSSEFRIRIAVGAPGFHLLRQALLEQLPLLVLSLLFGLLLSELMLPRWLEQFELRLGISLGLYIFATVITALVLVLLIAVSACLPIVQFLRKNHFSREANSRSSPWQHRLALANMAFQFFTAGLAISVTLALLISQWSHYRDLGLAERVVEWEINVAERESIIGNAPDWLAALDREEGEVALSAQNMLRPRSMTNEARLDTPDNSKRANINFMNVSQNYFSVLQTSLVAGQGLSERGVVINEAAANLLGYELPNDVVGRMLFIDDAEFILGFENEEPIPVLGVVVNIPHFGITNRNVPIVYGDLRRTPELASLSLLAAPQSAGIASEWLRARQAEDGGLWLYGTRGTLIEQLRDDNQFMVRMTQLALVLGIMICALAATSLYYQVGSHLRMMCRRYGTQLAVGAKGTDVFISVWQTLSVLMLSAFFPILIVLVLSNDWFLRELNIWMLDVNIIITSFVGLIFISFLSAYIPVYRLTRKSIAELIKHDD